MGTLNNFVRADKSVHNALFENVYNATETFAKALAKELHSKNYEVNADIMERYWAETFGHNMFRILADEGNTAEFALYTDGYNVQFICRTFKDRDVEFAVLNSLREVMIKVACFLLYDTDEDTELWDCICDVSAEIAALHCEEITYVG